MGQMGKGLFEIFENFLEICLNFLYNLGLRLACDTGTSSTGLLPIN